MTKAAASAVAIGTLRKSFGATLAVDDVSFTIEQGTAHALLGENGAGKSTIVKLLSGLIEPDHGTISLFGDAVSRPRSRK
jgi:ribose transport system ATP-binding protein